MAERIRIVIDADDNASRELKKSQSSLKSLQKTALAVGAAVAGFAVTARQAFKAVEQAAELELARERFDNLATSIGSTGDALLGKFSRATGGMLSDAEMIASASQIISTGLADNEQDVIRLATVVSELGLDMQQVILTFANNSKMRLDSLGLSVSDVDARTQELVATGMTMDEAFDAAVLELLEDRLELMGSAADTTAGDIKTLRATWSNLADDFRAGLLDAVAEDIGLIGAAAQGSDSALRAAARGSGEFVGSIKEGLKWLPPVALGIRAAEARLRAEAEAALSASDAVDEHGEAMMRNDRILSDWRQAQISGTEATQQSAAAADRATLAYADNWEWLQALNTIRERNIEQEREHQVTTEHLIRAQHDQSAELLPLEERVGHLSDAYKEAVAEGQMWMEAHGGLEDITDHLGTAFTDAINMAEDETVNFTETMLQAAAQGGANAESLAILAAATGNYTDAQIEAAIETAAMTTKAQQLGEAVASGAISAEDALTAFKNFQAQLQEPYDVEITDNSDEAIANINAVKAAADAAAGTRVIRYNVQYGSSGTAIGGIPENAHGTDYFQGGLTWVGEQGRELVALPRGSRIFSNRESQQIVNNYNLSVETTSSLGRVQDDFAVMQAMGA